MSIRSSNDPKICSIRLAESGLLVALSPQFSVHGGGGGGAGAPGTCTSPANTGSAKAISKAILSTRLLMGDPLSKR